MAPELKQKLQSDLTTAIKGRDELTTATLRMVLTAVRSAEVAGEVARELEDDEVQGVLRREAKKRREAATAFADAGRAASAEREQAEMAVIEAYLPKQLSDDELSALVDAAVAEAADNGKTGMAAMGLVIKSVQASAEGRADGGRIAALVKARLGQG